MSSTLPDDAMGLAASSLLSLSLVAANAEPIPIHGSNTNASTVAGSYGSNTNQQLNLSASIGAGNKQHRRLASSGKARRRLSDARDAASRLSPANLHSPAAGLSLATLSLSPSVPLQGNDATSAAVPIPVMASEQSGGVFSSSSVPEHDAQPITPSSVPIAINGSSKGGKKRGMDHKCESCSKIYRHPSCLIKHRWEHTPHWREASKFVLSKHQQVQLLEAAAILSHLSPATGTSLPEDRSLWPSFLSGGRLPSSTMDESQSNTAIPSGTPNSATAPSSTSPGSAPISSSVPTRAGSTGPRLYDYSIPSTAAGARSITQVRPGLVGVPTPPGGAIPFSSGATLAVPTTHSQPVPVPNAATGIGASFGSYRSAAAASSVDSWGSYDHSGPGRGGPVAGEGAVEAGGWSLPPSSLRSEPSSLADSRSRSRSRSDDESVDVDVELEDDFNHREYGSRREWNSEADRRPAVKEEDEEFEMEMEMD